MRYRFLGCRMGESIQTRTWLLNTLSKLQRSYIFYDAFLPVIYFFSLAAAQRSEEVEGLQTQLDDIKKAIEPMVGKSHPLFVKDGEQGGNTPEVNNWGVYNAYK